MTTFKLNNNVFEVDDTERPTGLFRLNASTEYINLHPNIIGAKRLDMQNLSEKDHFVFFLIRCKNKSKNTDVEWIQVDVEEGKNIINKMKIKF